MTHASFRLSAGCRAPAAASLTWVLAFCGFAVLVATPAALLAQTAGTAARAQRKPLPSKPSVVPASRIPGRPGSFEVSASALWFGTGSLGTSEAQLTANQTGGSQAYTLFRSSGEFTSSVGVQAGVSYNLTRTFTLEAGFTYSPSRIRYVISDDRELAAGFTSPTERLSEYLVEGTLLMYLRRLAFSGGRVRPYLSGGVGYMRQLPEERTLVETGQVYHVGGGAKYTLGTRPRGLVRAFGMRVDARLYLRSGGFSFDERTTPSFGLSAGLLAAF